MIQASVYFPLNRFEDTDLILREFHIDTGGWGWDSNGQGRNFSAGTIKNRVAFGEFVVGDDGKH